MLDRGDRKMNPEEKNLIITSTLAIIGIFPICSISIEPCTCGEPFITSTLFQLLVSVGYWRVGKRKQHILFMERRWDTGDIFIKGQNNGRIKIREER